MRAIEVGSKGKAICARCGLAGTTYQYRDVPFSDGVGAVMNVLAGVCDGCGAVVAMPSQSTAEVAEARFEALAGRGAPK